MAVGIGIIRVLLFLVLAGLSVLTIVTWKRYPRTALFVLLGFAALAVSVLLGLVSGMFVRPGMSVNAYRLAVTVSDVVTTLLEIGGLGLLGVALFLRRPTEPSQPPQRTQPPQPTQQAQATPPTQDKSYYGAQPPAPASGPAGPPPPPPAQPGPGGPQPLWPGNQGH
jgi:hypothetical protein